MWRRTVWWTESKFLDEYVAIIFRNEEGGFCTNETLIQTCTFTRCHISENSDSFIYSRESDGQRVPSTPNRSVLCDTSRQLLRRVATWCKPCCLWSLSVVRWRYKIQRWYIKRKCLIYICNEMLIARINVIYFMWCFLFYVLITLLLQKYFLHSH
jgi:hypothetical protein